MSVDTSEKDSSLPLTLSDKSAKKSAYKALEIIRDLVQNCVQHPNAVLSLHYYPDTRSWIVYCEGDEGLCAWHQHFDPKDWR